MLSTSVNTTKDEPASEKRGRCATARIALSTSSPSLPAGPSDSRTSTSVADCSEFVYLMNCALYGVGPGTSSSPATSVWLRRRVRSEGKEAMSRTASGSRPSSVVRTVRKSFRSLKSTDESTEGVVEGMVPLTAWQ